jgi:hypothetical protein
MNSFYLRRFQKRKKTVQLSVFFELFGFERAKAACRKLMKLTPDGDRFADLYRTLAKSAK